MSQVFSQYLQSVTRAFRRPLLLAMLSAGIVSLSAVGLLGLSGWFLTAAAVAGAAGPIAAQALNYLLPSAAIRLFAILRTGFRYLERLWGHEGGLKAMARVRPHLFERLMMGRPSQILALSQGEASSRFLQDVGVLETALVAKSAPAFAITGVVAAVMLCVPLGIMAALTGLAGLMAVLFIGWKVSLWVGQKRAGDIGDDEQAQMGALKQRVFELTPLLPDMAAFDLDAAVLAGLSAHEDALMRAKTRTLSLDSLLTVVSSVVMALTLICVVIISRTGNPACLAMALLGLTMGFESAGALLRAWSQSRLFKAAEVRIGDLYDLGGDDQVKPSHTDYFVYSGKTTSLSGDLRLLISGASGAGKSRLIHALMGLTETKDVSGLGDVIPPRQAFSLCPQEATILSGTIRENLTMAVTDEALPEQSKADLEAQLLQALDDAGLSARLASMAQGLDTWIGEGGITLSGGERKRLSLARAYLREARVLILDEPTEGLDATMEAFVIERLHHRLARTGQGLIFTSHRPMPRKLATSELTIS